MSRIFLIGLGGFLGAASRYGISKWVNNKWHTNFINGTLLVNILGCFLIGFFMTLFLNRELDNHNLNLALTTGFLGALTTFSTFGYETIKLLEKGEYLFAGINILSNVLLSLAFVFLGILTSKLL